MCRYNLTGLPREHRCPECGFEYTATMRVWQTAPFSRSESITAILFGPGLAVLILIAVRLAGSPGFPTGSLLVLLAVIGLTPLIGMTIRMRSTRAFITLDKDRLVLRSMLGRVRTFAWSELWIPDPDRWMMRPPSNSPVQTRGWLSKWRDLTRWRSNECYYIYRRVSTASGMRYRRITLPVLHANYAGRCSLHRELYDEWSRTQRSESTTPSPS